MTNPKRSDRFILLESRQILDPDGRLNGSLDLPMKQWDGVTVQDDRRRRYLQRRASTLPSGTRASLQQSATMQSGAPSPPFHIATVYRS